MICGTAFTVKQTTAAEYTIIYAVVRLYNEWCESLKELRKAISA